MLNGSRVPHSLRLIIFFLRLVLGLSFFFIGFANLFNAPIAKTLEGRSLPGLYAWLANTPAGGAETGSLHLFFQWAFLTIGALIVVGLFMRLASIIGAVMVAWSILPAFTASPFDALRFVNDSLIALICLLILIFANAGAYFGLDSFLHFGRTSK